MSERQLIEVNPNKCGGRPCVAGTSLSLARLLEEVAGDFSLSEIAGAHGTTIHVLSDVISDIAKTFDVPIHECVSMPEGERQFLAMVEASRVGD